MIKANHKIGNTTLQIEAEDIKGLFREFELLSQMPQQCSCGSRDIGLGYSKTAKEGFEFFYLKCQHPECGNEYAFGQRKSDQALFPKGEWKAPYKGGQREEAHDEQGPGY